MDLDDIVIHGSDIAELNPNRVQYCSAKLAQLSLAAYVKCCYSLNSSRHLLINMSENNFGNDSPVHFSNET